MGGVTENVPGSQGAELPSRICVVVLGSGRSGTSAVSRLLTSLGVPMSNSPAGDQNPDGFYEDQFIVDAHKKIFSGEGISPYFPLDLSRISRGSSRYIFDQIGNRIEQEVEAHGIWGVKDPRFSSFLPLYRKAFNKARIVPKYILCVRDPKSVIESFSSNYGDAPRTVELVWLNRNLAALRETYLNCFIAHYEDLVENPTAMAEALSQFVFEQPRPLESGVSTVIRPELNRSALNRGVTNSPLVEKLYDALKLCRGYDFDRTALREVVNELSAIEETYLPWAYEGGRIAVQLRRRVETLAEELRVAKSAVPSEEEAQQVASMKEDIAALVADNARLNDEFVELRNVAEGNRNRALALENELERERSEAQRVAALLARAEKAHKASLKDLADTLERVKILKTDVKTLKGAKEDVKKIKSSRRYRIGNSVVEFLESPLSTTGRGCVYLFKRKRKSSKVQKT